jgi:general secretion pathway protein D
MVRCKKIVSCPIFKYIGLFIVLGTVLPAFADRRDRIRRKRANALLVTQNDESSPEPLLTRFLGVPQEPIGNAAYDASLARFLGAEAEVPTSASTMTEPNNDAYETVEIELPEDETIEEAITPEETVIVDPALQTISDAIPIDQIPEEIDDVTILPTTAVNHEDEIELYFENADLLNFVQQVEDVFNIKFIMEDSLDPLPQGAKSLKGNKISYRTQKPITLAQTWNTFNTFLNIAGFAIVPQADHRVYRITTIPRAQKSPLAAYIGVAPETLPDGDELIRYVYFIENNTVEAIQPVIEQFRSSASSAVYLKEHKGFILTDIAYNIKKLMEVIKELDKVTMPESLSVLKLRRADAKQVKELYDTLVQNEQPNKFGPRVLPKKQASALSLPENVTIVAEPRTNSLILLGPKNARESIEQFIIKNIDVELDQAYSPLHIYQLRYANAETIADIMNSVTKFGAETDAGKSGGVRSGDQYLRPMSFTAEPATNQLIVRGHYEDYLKAEKIIRQLDADQPQVAIEILILSLTATDTKELGTQMRSKIDNLATNSGGWDGLLGNNVKFQTSGLFASGSPSGIVQNTTNGSPGVQRLLGNLISLVTGAGPGNTIVTLGQDIAGVWGILQMLETVLNVQLVSNPFLIATNKTPAEVSLGETRRVATATVVGSTTSDLIQANGNESANLVVKATPQITSDGMISMNLDITIDNFTSAVETNPTKNTKRIVTNTILANKQVLALGGLVRHVVNNDMNQVPILGDIPILGWFFKNKRKVQDKQNLLILVSARIVEPTNPKDLAIYNNKHIGEYHATLSQLQTASENRDPIHNLFFAPAIGDTEREIDDFIFKRKKGRGTTRRKRILDREARLVVQKKQKTELVTPAPTVVASAPTVTVAAPPQMPAKVAAATARKPTVPHIVSAIEAPRTQSKKEEPDKLLQVKNSLKTKARTNLSISDMLQHPKKAAQGVTT